MLSSVLRKGYLNHPGIIGHLPTGRQEYALGIAEGSAQICVIGKNFLNPFHIASCDNDCRRWCYSRTGCSFCSNRKFVITLNTASSLYEFSTFLKLFCTIACSKKTHCTNHVNIAAWLYEQIWSCLLYMIKHHHYNNGKHSKKLYIIDWFQVLSLII